MNTAIHSVPDRAPDPVRLSRALSRSPLPRPTTCPRRAGRRHSWPGATDGPAATVRARCPPPGCTWSPSTCNGVARLKLQPRFELTDGQRVVRHDGPPTYDAPPSVEDLFRDAARNHELERTHRAERMAAKEQQRDADRDRRSQTRPSVPGRSHAARDAAPPAHADALLSGDCGWSRDVRCGSRCRTGAGAAAGGVSGGFGPTCRARKERNLQAPGRAERLARREAAPHR